MPWELGLRLSILQNLPVLSPPVSNLGILCKGVSLETHKFAVPSPLGILSPPLLSCAVLRGRGMSSPSLICPVTHSIRANTGIACSWTWALCVNPALGLLLLATTPPGVGPPEKRGTQPSLSTPYSRRRHLPSNMSFFQSPGHSGSPHGALCTCRTQLTSPNPGGPSERRPHLDREWLLSWCMCGLYWARMVMVSHCCPMMSRACCSVALRRFMPLNWGTPRVGSVRRQGRGHGAHRFSIGGRQGGEEGGEKGVQKGSSHLPQAADPRTQGRPGERCCPQSPWTHRHRPSLHSRWRCPVAPSPSAA